VRGNARSLMIPILVLLGTLLSCPSLLAADYSVDFGVETDAGKDAGSLTCLFGQICDAKVKSLRLRVSIDVLRSEPGRASIRLYGGDLSCCYFAYAADSIAIDTGKSLSRVPFFRGAGARGGPVYSERTCGHPLPQVPISMRSH
jgi:hypothetical protein